MEKAMEMIGPDDDQILRMEERSEAMMEEMDEERDVDYIIDEERDSPSMRYVTLEPNWEATCLWFATALSTHEFDYGAKAPVVTLIEQVRHLTKTDPEALDRIIERLK